MFLFKQVQYEISGNLEVNFLISALREITQMDESEQHRLVGMVDVIDFDLESPVLNEAWIFIRLCPAEYFGWVDDNVLVRSKNQEPVVIQLQIFKHFE